MIKIYSYNQSHYLKVSLSALLFGVVLLLAFINQLWSLLALALFIAFIPVIWISSEIMTAIVFINGFVWIGIGRLYQLPFTIMGIALLLYIILLTSYGGDAIERIICFGSKQKYFLYFLVWNAMMLIFSQDIYMSLKRLVAFGAFLIYSLLLSGREIKYKNLYLLVAVSNSIILLCFLFNPIGITAIIGGRLAGNSANLFGGSAMLVCILSTLAIAFGQPRKLDYFIVAMVFPVGLVMLLLTNSRANMLGFVCGMALLMITMTRRDWLRITVPTIVILCLVLYFAQTTMRLFPKSILGVAYSEGWQTLIFKRRMGSSRTHLWRTALSYTDIRSLLLGRGFASTDTIESGGGGGWHNLLLQLLTDSGIVGISLYVAFLISSIRRIGSQRIVLPVVVSLLVSGGMFESWIVLSPSNPATFFFHFLLLTDPSESELL